MKKRKAFRFFMSFVVLLLMSVQTAAAAPEGSIKLEYDPCVAGAEVTLYYAADIAADGSYKTTASLADSNVDLSGKDANSMKIAAYSLWCYASAEMNAVEPSAVSKIGSDGTVSFGGLRTGLYLVATRRLTVGTTVYECAPFLISVPQTEKDTNETVYNIEASPKVETSTGNSGSVSDISIQKLWDDSTDRSARPDEITVLLLSDGVVYERIILNDANFWRYTRRGLKTGTVWTVLEENVADGYTVTYQKNLTSFIVTNTTKGQTNPTTEPATDTTTDDSGTTTDNSGTTTDDSGTTTDNSGTTTDDSGTTTDNSGTTTNGSGTTTNGSGSTTDGSSSDSSGKTPTSGGEKLPQTGLLQWPVPILATAGMLLFGAGWMLIYNRRQGT